MRMNMRLFIKLVLISIVIVSNFSFNVALGQEQTINRSSGITLSPIYAPGDAVKKSFQKEFWDMVRCVEHDDH